MIADDIIYFAEPYYQDGIVANAVNDVTTNQGVAYFSMAFNNNRIIAGNDSNSWEAPAYRNAGSCPALVGGTDCMDFDPGPGVDNTFDLTWSGTSLFRIGLQWAEPQNGVATNLEHLWYLELPQVTGIRRNEAEHCADEWLDVDAAIRKVSSWTNREALERLRDSRGFG